MFAVIFSACIVMMHEKWWVNFSVATWIILFAIPPNVVLSLTIYFLAETVSTTKYATNVKTQVCDRDVAIWPKRCFSDDSDLIIDVVKQQYLSFPYPYVSSQDIEFEQDYYQGIEKNITLVT